MLVYYQAVIKHILDKTPLDPDVARRIDERAGRIIERLRRENVDIDVVQLLREARDEE